MFNYIRDWAVCLINSFKLRQHTAFYDIFLKILTQMKLKFSRLLNNFKKIVEVLCKLLVVNLIW